MGPNRTTTVTGPLGDPVEAGWRLAGRTAVIEMARASGLALVGGAEGNDAVARLDLRHRRADRRGARRGGATTIVVGVGGSATTDGGLGALRALYPLHRLRGVELEVACDVRLGLRRRGAGVRARRRARRRRRSSCCERRLERLVQVYAEEYGVDVTDLEGAGAAGGLAGGLACVGRGRWSPASTWWPTASGLDESVEAADLVVTGEGFLDDESFDGKVVGGVAEMADALGRAGGGRGRRVPSTAPGERRADGVARRALRPGAGHAATPTACLEPASAQLAAATRAAARAAVAAGDLDHRRTLARRRRSTGVLARTQRARPPAGARSPDRPGAAWSA